jgi:hypothetical protein
MHILIHLLSALKSFVAVALTSHCEKPQKDRRKDEKDIKKNGDDK